METERRPLRPEGLYSDQRDGGATTAASFRLENLDLEGSGYQYERTKPLIDDWRGTQRWIRLTIMGLSGLALCLAALLAVAVARLPHEEQVLRASAADASSPDVVSFFAVGDWGRAGRYNQTEVAQLMSLVAPKANPQFIVSTGDNMYPSGLAGTDDPLFSFNFQQIYTQDSLQLPWHSVLGNHDYGDNGDGQPREPAAQLSAELTRQDWRWHCERSYTLPLAGGRVELFMVDTSPFIKRYHKHKWAQHPGGLAEQSWRSQLAELESRLARSKAEWKLLVGHHPPRSNGHHGNNSEIMEAFEPLIQRYNVAAWFAGHDHSLEHLQHSDVPYHTFVSGAGSQCNRGFVTSVDSRYQHRWSGFVAAEISGDELRVDYYTLEKGEEPAYTAVVPRRKQ